MTFASLPAWLAWLETCHPREIDLGLERISSVAGRMGLLTTTAKLVTVGGTNGKGSCVTATAALLRAAGYSVGVYTSPHLLAYNERIQVDGQQVSDAEVCASFERIYAACHAFPPTEPVSLTYFEFGTLAALDIFRERQVTAMVLEVGLGGRLDAVNIIDADVAVITSVDIDHQDWLGDNREDIGQEKAGIYRAGKPAICADAQPPQTLLNAIAALPAQGYLRNRDFGYELQGDGYWCWWGSAGRFEFQPLPQLPLPSMAAALEAISHLGVAIDARSFQLLASLRVPGRFQQLSWQGRQVILDVAHNPAATAYLAQGLDRLRQSLPQAQVFGLVAMMSDKDRGNSLANLQGLVDHWYLVELEAIPRAASVEQLRANLHELGLVADASGSLPECLAQVLAHSQVGDICVIFGSFFTVAAGLTALAPQLQS